MKHIIALLVILFTLTTLSAQEDSLAFWLKSLGNRATFFNAQAINTPYLEFSPTFYLNGVVYVSSRNQGGWKDKNTGEAFYQLYYSEALSSGALTKPYSFSPQINSHLHEGPAAFSPEGDVMYFTRNNIQQGVSKADEAGIVRLKIYQARKGALEWEKITELPFNSSAYSCAHPTLSSDGSRLYFASDMPGGFGGMDIFYSKKIDGNWTTPVNMGPEVNTPKNEIFPFIFNDKILFFSSDGHQGMGGLDIRAWDISGSWKETIPLDPPFNSEADDLGLIFNALGNKGYFSSARNGGAGQDDIYYFELNDKYETPEALRSKPLVLEIFDVTTQKPLDEARCYIFEENVEGYLGVSGQLYVSRLMPVDESTGELVFKLLRKDEKELGNPDFYSNSNGKVRWTFEPQTKYLLYISKEGYQSKELFFSSRTAILEDSVMLIDMEPISCTNLELSVVNLENRNPLDDAVVRIDCNCDIPEKVMVTNQEGNAFDCLNSQCDYEIKVSKEGFKSFSKRIDANRISDSDLINERIALAPLSSILRNTSELKEGAVIVLENIYYDFNKSSIRLGAARELQELAGIMMRYPSMDIELVSHTDARGDAKYNLSLSQRRSASAKQYLVSQGIDPKRIKTVGRGEKDIRNHCLDGVRCSDEEHEYNRRTEVRVLRIDEEVDFRYKD